jgi:hypothetical protein
MVVRVDKVVEGNVVNHQHKAEDIDDLATSYLKLDASNGPLTGALEIDKTSTTALDVAQDDGTSVFVVDTSNKKVTVISGTTGQSTIDAGLVVNNSSGSDAICDFQVNSDTKVAIKVDASEDTLDLGVNTQAEIIVYKKKIVSKTADYTATTSDEIILVDASSSNVTITLPAVSGNSGVHFHIKKTDSSTNTVTVDGSGSETIDGATTQVISSQYDSMHIVCDGTEWWIL